MCVQRVQRTHTEVADHWGPPWSIAALAWHAAATGNHHKAALLLGAARRQRQLIGVDMEGITLLARLDVHAESVARTGLGPLAYATAYRHGAALNSHDATIALTNGRIETRHEHDTTNGHAPEDLTKREFDVAHLLGQDPSMTNKEMATRLYISMRTVDTHIRNILRKLGLTSRAQIAVWAATRAGQR